MGGYYEFEADSYEEAIQLASRVPAARQGGAVEIRPSKVYWCPESDWPYDDTPAPYDGGPFPVGSKPATQPPQSAYDNATSYTITSYQALQQTLRQLQGTLVSGFPFVFGFNVYEKWADTESTIVPLPGSDSLVAGHAVLAIGYDNSTALFKFRNSWGPGRGGIQAQSYFGGHWLSQDN